MSNEVYDVLVVGGSWAGLAAAMQLGRARRRTLVVDAGSPRNRFARSSHGFLGQDGRAPAEILETFRDQVLSYPTVSLATEVVTNLRRAGDDVWAAELWSGAAIESRRLLIATGVTDELPPLPGLKERWGVTVAHCPYCHGYEVADRRLGVLATGEMSIHQALLLPDWSAHVTFFTNGAFTPDAEQREALAARNVRVEPRHVEALVGDTPELAGVRLVDGELVEIDALFTSSRTRMASPLAEQLGCELENGVFGPFVRTDERKQTSVGGVFCAGDAARGMHSATWAVADGAMAGISAHQSLVFGPPHPASHAPKPNQQP